MTGFLRALEILDQHREGVFAEDFYRLMWPEKWEAGLTDKGARLSRGSTKGGPSRAQCAANWLLGRVDRKWPRSVRGYAFLDEDRRRAGRWFIQPEGREILKKEREACGL